MNYLSRIQIRLRGVFYGWWIVAGAIVLLLLQGALLAQVFGTYAAIWKEEFGWSSTALATAYSAQLLLIGILAPGLGRLLQHLGTRRVITAGVLLFGLGLLALSSVRSLGGLFLIFLLLSLGVSLSGFLPLTTAVVNWFDRGRTTAVALMQTGISIGGLLIPAVTWLIVHYGWRTTLAGSGLVVLLVGFPLAHLFRSPSEGSSILPNGISTGGSSALRSRPLRRDFTTRQVLCTRAFWLLSFGHASGAMIVSALIVHVVIYLSEQFNYSLQNAAYVVALMTGLAAMGQLLGGALGDRYSKRVLAAIAMCGHAAALAALMLGATLVFAVLQGLSLGVRGPQVQSLLADYFGLGSFATILGMESLIVMFGKIGGPILVGYLVDSSGHYLSALLLLAAVALVGSCLFMLAREPQPPYEALT